MLKKVKYLSFDKSYKNKGYGVLLIAFSVF